MVNNPPLELTSETTRNKEDKPKDDYKKNHYVNVFNVHNKSIVYIKLNCINGREINLSKQDNKVLTFKAL